MSKVHARPARGKVEVSVTAPPPGFWHNHKEPCGAQGCLGWPAQLRQDRDMLDAFLAAQTVAEAREAEDAGGEP